MLTKKDVRRISKEYRNSLTPSEIEFFSEAIANTLFDTDFFQNSDTVYIYKNIGFEVITDSIIDRCLAMNKQVAIPRVEGDLMNFYYITDNLNFTTGYMDIKEPPKDSGIADGNSGIIIIPALAYDVNFHRCGYGGGFYDKYLSVHPKLLRVGINYEACIYDEIESDEHDEIMEIIITDCNIYNRNEE